MIHCTLVAGSNAAQREAAIAALVEPQLATAIILEGAQGDTTALAASVSAKLKVATIASGCPCCGDGLVMRVTLNRMLQQKPARLFVSLADASHLIHLQQFLGAPPYVGLVQLTPAINC